MAWHPADAWLGDPLRRFDPIFEATAWQDRSPASVRLVCTWAQGSASSLSNSHGVHSESEPLKRRYSHPYPWLVAVIVFGGIIGPLLLMFGLNATTASSDALLLNLEHLATMAIAWLVFRENVDNRLLIGAFAILAGSIVLFWQGQGVRLDSAAAFIAGACLAWENRQQSDAQTVRARSIS